MNKKGLALPLVGKIIAIVFLALILVTLVPKTLDTAEPLRTFSCERTGFLLCNDNSDNNKSNGESHNEEKNCKNYNPGYSDGFNDALRDNNKITDEALTQNEYFYFLHAEFHHGEVNCIQNIDNTEEEGLYLLKVTAREETRYVTISVVKDENNQLKMEDHTCIELLKADFKKEDKCLYTYQEAKDLQKENKESFTKPVKITRPTGDLAFCKNELESQGADTILNDIRENFVKKTKECGG